MLVQFLILVLGLILLIKGADWMVNGASSLARKYNVSDLAIGLTIVAFGTSAPELVVNLYAAIQNHHDLVFGNVIGSNNINLFVILGIAGLITPMAVQSSTVWKEIPFSLLAAVLLFVLANNFSGNGVGSISRIDGLVLLALFAGFLFYVYKQLKNDAPAPSEAVQTMPPLKIWGLILVGMAGLVGRTNGCNQCCDHCFCDWNQRKNCGADHCCTGNFAPRACYFRGCCPKEKQRYRCRKHYWLKYLQHLLDSGDQFFS